MLRFALPLFALTPLVGSAAGQAPQPVAGLLRPEPPSGPGALAPNLSARGDQVLLSWLEPTGEAGRHRGGAPHALRWARLEGERWSEARTLVEGRDLFVNWADFPSVVAAGDGRLLAHWLVRAGRGGFGYGIELAMSPDAGKTWQRLGSPHPDSAEGEHGFVSIVPEGRGFRLFWLDGRELAMGGGGGGSMTLRTALVEDGVGEQIVLDGDVCTCCQTGVALTSRGPAIVYRDHEAGEIRDISIIQPEGEGWSEPANVFRDGWEIPACPVNGPAIDADRDAVAVAWFTRAQGRPRVRVAFSADGGATFRPAVTLDDAEPLGRAAVVLAPGGAIVGWLGSEGEQASFRIRHVSAAGDAGPILDVGRTALSRSSGFPRMVVRGEDLVMAWRETSEPARLRSAILPLAALLGGDR